MASGITYTYLADGTRLSARKSDGSGVVARGNFSYAVSANGSVALESVAHPEGRIYVGTPDGDVWDCWNVTDHLGNVRSVVNPDGSGMEFMLEQSDYLPFGMRLNQSSPLLSDLQRWHYAGKEYQKFGSVDLGMIDFGARYYSPFLGRWSTIDPLASKYLAASPYGYCGANPMNFVDPEGEDIYLLFDGKEKSLSIYYKNEDGDGEDILLGVFPAHNKADSKSKGPWEDGEYNIIDKYSGHKHPNEPQEDTKDGAYGESGIYRAESFTQTNGDVREGMGVHSGREDRPFESRYTLGCIRTTQEGMSAIDRSIKEFGPLQSITIKNNRKRNETQTQTFLLFIVVVRSNSLFHNWYTDMQRRQE